MVDAAQEMRVIIRARVTDIPDDPLRRPTTLGDLGFANVLSRPFNRMVAAEGHDGVFISPRFDSEKPVSEWFAYDVNVKGKKNEEELLALPHKVNIASRQGENWRGMRRESYLNITSNFLCRVFVLRENWSDSAKSRCKSYVWGGRSQQEWMAQMRQNNDKATN